MARIRTIKPEFWEHPLVIAYGLQVCASVRVMRTSRQSWAGLPGGDTGDGFLYFFLDGQGQLLYVGRAVNARYRVPQHRRKKWWKKARRVEVAQISCDDWREAERGMKLLEAIAIDMMEPPCNIVSPSELMMKEVDRALVQS